jgi:hypothetical protein
MAPLKNNGNKKIPLLPTTVIIGLEKVTGFLKEGEEKTHYYQ